MGVRLFLLLQRSDDEAANVSVCKTDIRGFESLSELSASLAQPVEHLLCKQRVAGSIPVGGSKIIINFAPAKPLWIWHRIHSSQHVGEPLQASLAVPYPRVRIVIIDLQRITSAAKSHR